MDTLGSRLLARVTRLYQRWAIKSRNEPASGFKPLARVGVQRIDQVLAQEVPLRPVVLLACQSQTLDPTRQGGIERIVISPAGNGSTGFDAAHQYTSGTNIFRRHPWSGVMLEALHNCTIVPIPIGEKDFTDGVAIRVACMRKVSRNRPPWIFHFLERVRRHPDNSASILRCNKHGWAAPPFFSKLLCYITVTNCNILTLYPCTNSPHSIRIEA